jgi:subfamily B ATP-binding cassette protein MsbA
MVKTKNAGWRRNEDFDNDHFKKKQKQFELKKEPGTLRKIRYLIEGHKKYALLLFIVMLVAAVTEGLGLSLILPLLHSLVGMEGSLSVFTKYTNSFLSVFPKAYRIEVLLAALVLAFLLKSVLMIIHRGMSTHFAMRLRKEWASRIFRRYLESDYEQIISQRQGTLISNVTNEPLRASKALILLLELLCKLTLFLVLFGMLLVTDWKLTLIAGAASAFILYALRKTTHQYSITIGQENVKLNQGVTAISAESISAVKEIKIFGIGPIYVSRLRDNLERYCRLQTRFMIFSDLPGQIIEFIIILFVALALAYIHIARSAHFKEVIPFLGFFLIVSQRMLVYITFVISYRMRILSFFPAFDLIYELTRVEKKRKEQSQKHRVDQLKDDIILKNVSFAYGEGRWEIQHLNLVIPRGKMTALVGPSGIGKSTIANLILGLFLPQDGEILINRKDIRELDLASWRDRVGYVGQEPVIFNATIRENILVGKPSAKDHEIIWAAKMANIHTFFMRQQDGYETLVGDRGLKLSGGQRQRLAIARAIIRRPDFYIFDEATTSLDRQSERLVQQAIETLSRTKTILVIAHRISTLEKADFIYSLEEGGKLVVQDFQSLEESEKQTRLGYVP